MKHLKNHTLKCLALIAATSLIGGCSVREATPIINAKPIDTQNRPAEAAPVDPADADARIKNLDPDALSNKRLNAKNALDLLNEVVKPLSEALLAPAAFTSVDTTSSMEFFRALRELNEGIYKLDQMDAKLLKESGVLPRYQKALYYDCDINLRGNCPNLNLYAREARFGTVLTIIAKDEADVLKYYRLLYTALERFRSESDQNLNFMYLDRHQELARLVLKDKSVPGSAGEQEAMRLHSRVLSNILQDFDIEKVSKAQMDRLMANFNPWDASRKTEGIAAVGIDKLLGWAANGYLYTDKTKTKLDPTFVKRVVAILDGKDDEFGLGLRTIYNDIQKSDSKRILENFRLVSDFEPDEYIYLVDRIYYAHFTIDDGMAMWKVTGRDRGRLFKALNIFARLQIANMIVWTNREMNKFFEESPDKFKDVLGLLRGAVNNSLTMHAQSRGRPDPIRRPRVRSSRHVFFGQRRRLQAIQEFGARSAPQHQNALGLSEHDDDRVPDGQKGLPSHDQHLVGNVHDHSIRHHPHVLHQRDVALVQLRHRQRIAVAGRVALRGSLRAGDRNVLVVPQEPGHPGR
ncbi:MAG TPA: hypothetical protein PKC28_11080 [Bdellovibrionales bacterium]|nr:hypothetical protein [Bdellovibrionales bacterium]